MKIETRITLALLAMVALGCLCASQAEGHPSERGAMRLYATWNAQRDRMDKARVSRCSSQERELTCLITETFHASPEICAAEPKVCAATTDLWWTFWFHAQVSHLGHRCLLVKTIHDRPDVVRPKRYCGETRASARVQGSGPRPALLKSHRDRREPEMAATAEKPRTVKGRTGKEMAADAKKLAAEAQKRAEAKLENEKGKATPKRAPSPQKLAAERKAAEAEQKSRKRGGSSGTTRKGKTDYPKPVQDLHEAAVEVINSKGNEPALQLSIKQTATIKKHVGRKDPLEIADISEKLLRDFAAGKKMKPEQTKGVREFIASKPEMKDDRTLYGRKAAGVLVALVK